MNLSVGIMGLPNVGKSTLFNALLKKQAAFVANYPFATIEPNVGVVPVADYRLVKLQETIRAATPGVEPPIKPATVEFVDIAGLVKGASEGAGLGNKFLSHIREVQIIAHVVRAFADENVIKEGSIDPRSDYETITTELILADLASIEKSDKKKEISIHKKTAIEKLTKVLNEGIPAKVVQLNDEEKEATRDLFLLSAKPEIIVLNVSENEILKRVQDDKGNTIVICAKIEAELSELSEDEQKEYLKNLGLEQSGLERLIKKAYETLGLISFLTAGEKEVKAWTLRAGSTTLSASRVIHTDFEKNFIKAEIIPFDDFVSAGGWKKARDLGKTRMEGRDYVMQDGDVVEFKVNA